MSFVQLLYFTENSLRNSELYSGRSSCVEIMCPVILYTEI